MQIKKITALFMMLAAVASSAFSQSVHGGSLPPLKPVEKTVYDTAYVKVYYDSHTGQTLSAGGGRTVRRYCSWATRHRASLTILTTGQISSTTRSPLPNAHRWKLS